MKEGKAVGKACKDYNTDCGSSDFSYTAVKRNSTDYAGCNRIHFVALTSSCACVCTECFQKCSATVENSCHNEYAHRNPENRNSRNACGFRVSAYCVHVFSKSCFVPDKPCYYNCNYCRNNQFRECNKFTVYNSQNPAATD